MQGRRGWLGEGRVDGVQVLGNLDEVSRGDGDTLGESARPVHADDLPLLAKVRTTALALVTVPAGNQRIDYHGRTCSRAFHDSTHRFVAEDQWRNAPRVVTEISMQVRSANAYGVDSNNDLPGTGLGGRLVPELNLFFGGIDQCLHICILSRRSRGFNIPEMEPVTIWL
jgi:hypothetical protein